MLFSKHNFGKAGKREKDAPEPVVMIPDIQMNRPKNISAAKERSGFSPALFFFSKLIVEGSAGSEESAM
jgi:hypothetical protein